MLCHIDNSEEQDKKKMKINGNSPFLREFSLHSHSVFRCRCIYNVFCFLPPPKRQKQE